MGAEAAERSRRPSPIGRVATCLSWALLAWGGLSCTAVAQYDVQLWLHGGVDVKVHEQVEVQLDQRLRLSEDLGAMDEWLHEIALQYELLDWMALTGGYRLIYRPDQPRSDKCCRHRVQGDADFQTDVGDVELAARMRLQSRFDPEDEPRNVFRLKFSVTLETWKQVRPFAEVEGFTDVLGPGKPRADKLRLTLGLQIRVKKPGRLEPFYRFEVPNDRTEPLLHILGLSGKYTLDARRKKKKRQHDGPELREPPEEPPGPPEAP